MERDKNGPQDSEMDPKEQELNKASAPIEDTAVEDKLNGTETDGSPTAQISDEEAQRRLDEAVLNAVSASETAELETSDEPTEDEVAEENAEEIGTEDSEDAEPSLDETAAENEDEASPITVSFDDADSEASGISEEPEINIVYSGDKKAKADGVTDEENSDGDHDTADEALLGDVARWFAKANSEGGEDESDESDELGDEDGDDDDVNPLDEIPSAKSGSGAGRGVSRESSEEALDNFHKKYKIPQRHKQKKEKEPEREEPPITDELLEQSDIVEDIRKQGKALTNNKSSLKSYADNSRRAIRDFTKARKEGEKALEANRDESQSPEIIVNLMKIVAKIVEIRCDNLENYARLKAYEYIRSARTALRRDISAYNEYAVAYSALTGEQLTRLSTFLPDNIASGKALAVIPVLGYKENYVQVYPDSEGKIPVENGSLLTTVIPPATAETVFGNIEAPKYSVFFGSYIRSAKKSIKQLSSHTSRIKQTIAKTSVAEQRYKDELRGLMDKTSDEKQNSEEYRRTVLGIRFKYGKRLTSIKTAKVKYAFAKTKVRLLVGCLAVEREKLAVAYRLLREACRIGKPKHRKAAEALFLEAASSYNKYVKRCVKCTGAKFDLLPQTILEIATKSREEYVFPIIAYKRELVETVGTESHTVSMALKEILEPDEKAYLESSAKILSGSKGIRDRVSLVDEAPMVDRASSVAKVIIETLREYADTVISADEFELYEEKSERAAKFFKKSIKRTETAIAKAFDENGVTAALVENLRVISNLIEVRRINISLASRLKRGDFARSESRALYKEIELYNGRAIDYMSIVGEQFTRITTAPINVLAESADKLRIPLITYKDNYIEVFPKDPLEESLHEKPTQRRGGYYTPLLMKHFRLTENRAVETTVVNSPFVFDVTIDEEPVISWWHPTEFKLLVVFQPIVAAVRRFKTNTAIWFIKTSLELSKNSLDNRGRKSDRKRRKLEAKLAKLNSQRNEKLLALETVVHDSDRNTAAYQRQLNKINSEFSRKVCKVKMRWMQDCPAQTEVRQMLERLVLDRELLIGVNKFLIKFRNYGRLTFTKNVLVGYRKMFLEAIQEHNETARKLSKMVGVEFSEVSTTVAEEIIRYGNMVRFPQIVCCREIIETVGDSVRSVGDKWHGYGLYTQNPGGTPSGAPPVMSVGAMGYSTEMGIPYFNADFNSMSIIGITPKGVPLIGFNNGGEVAIPFSGIPMMLRGEDDSPVLDAGIIGRGGPLIGGVNAANPYPAINSGAVDSIYVDNIEQKAKNGVTGETPIDVESAMIEERFLRSLNARSMTTVDSVGTWWRLIGSEINLMIQRALFLDKRGFMRILLPGDDEYLENLSILVPKQEKWLLSRISKLSTIINIESARLYSATKAGIRRSQRRFSAWLTRDIEWYNTLVEKYNKLSSNPNHSDPRRENEKLRPLSYSVPDRIRHRLDDRPPVPPKYMFRNRVRNAPFGWSAETPADSKKGDKVQRINDPVNTENVLDRLYEFVKASWFRHAEGFGLLGRILTVGRLWTIMLEYKLYKNHGWHTADSLVKRLRKEIDRRSKRTYRKRNDNEARHYFIRYEKARAMKRYNKRMLGAVGISADPVKYQRRIHGVLRNYVSSVFRIDYNMRIYQLIERLLRVSTRTYLIVGIPLLILMLAAALTMDTAVFLCIAFITACWAAIPFVLLIVQILYWIGYAIVYLLCMSSGIKQPLRYGAKDVENNRYGLVLDCFVCEQYRILAYSANVIYNPRSKKERAKLIAVVNEYNKRADAYSKLLRVNITEIEPTSLIDKLVSRDVHPLTEIQNFYYVRELVQINGEHDVGKRIDSAEMAGIRERLNRFIGFVAGGKAGVTENELDGFAVDVKTFVDMINDYGLYGGAKNAADEIKKTLSGYGFISAQHRSDYRHIIDKIIAKEYGKNKRKKMTALLDPLIKEVEAACEAVSEDAVNRFTENTRFVLGERARDGSGLTDEERFRVKEEIVSFVQKYPVDNTMIREEIARDFIKFIDDVGGTPERVIIASVALDNMIY